MGLIPAALPTLTLVWVGLVGLLPAFASFARAGADDVVAAGEALFRRGLEDMLAGRFATGCPALAESNRLDPRLGTLFTLAECHANAGEIASAVAHYQDFLVAVNRLPAAQRVRHRERVQVAERRKAELEPVVPQLILSLRPGTDPRAVVMRDGITLGQPARGVPLPIDPGRHVVSVQLPGGERQEVMVDIARGETKEVILPPPSTVAAPGAVGKGASASLRGSPQPPPPAVAVPRPGRLRRVGAVVGGAGAIVTIAGGASLVVAWLKVRSIDDDAAAERPFDEADGNYRRYNIAGLVLGAAGIAALATGGILYWRGRPRPHEGSARRVSFQPLVVPGLTAGALSIVF
jgi:hypothetical protein